MFEPGVGSGSDRGKNKYRSLAGQEERKAACISKVHVPQTDTGR